jgi:hypothetical protein
MFASYLEIYKRQTVLEFASATYRHESWFAHSGPIATRLRRRIGRLRIRLNLLNRTMPVFFGSSFLSPLKLPQMVGSLPNALYQGVGPVLFFNFWFLGHVACTFASAAFDDGATSSFGG